MAPGPPDCPPAFLPSCPSRWLKLPPLLSSSSVALRILAGETIALVFELAQDVEVRRGAVAAGGSGWAGSRAAGSCWHRHPARAPAELALTALGCTGPASPAGAQAEGLALVIPQPCPGDGCLRPLQNPCSFGRRTCASKIQSSCVPSSRSWLPRATSTEPRWTDGSSAPSSGTSCASLRYRRLVVPFPAEPVAVRLLPSCLATPLC